MTDTLLIGSMAAYGIAPLAFAIGRGAWRRWLVLAAVAIGFVFVSALIGERWLTAGRPPFKTLYESLLLFVWCGAGIYLAAERRARAPALGAGVGGLLLCALAYCALRPDVEVIQLPPALQSPWFIPHVLAYFVGYGALLLATVSAAASLASSEAEPETPTRSSPDIGYRRVMHSAIIAGYGAMTIGLVLGAVWAKEAWGDYWTWDPKECWALVSWLAYGIYFHARLLPGWRGRRSAWLALAAFAVVGFTYLGLHLLPTADSSAHVYL